MKPLFAVATALMLGACATSPEADLAPADVGQYDTIETDALESQALADREAATARRLAEAKDALLAKTLLHFDFDQAGVRGEYQAILAAHARQLRAHPEMAIRLEGHADERGTREYNVALGERRALNVRQALILQGVQPSQLTTVSYGEEQPIVLGRDEPSFEENRRVKMNYLNTNQASRSDTGSNSKPDA